MGELADRLDALVVNATSLDRQITAAFGRRGTQIGVAFRTGAYRRYTEAELAPQLAQLGTLTFVRFKRDCDETVERFCPNVLQDDGIEYGPETRQYRQRLEQIAVSAKSPDASITLETRALDRLTVVIAPGTLRRLSEEEFLAELHATLHLLLALYRAEVNNLREEIYGPIIPGYTSPRRQAPHANGQRDR